MDFDLDAHYVFASFRCHVDSLSPQLIESLPIVQTPSGGYHLYYRCPQISGATKLAMSEQGEETIIETRGQGSYVLAPHSPLSCHRLNKPYELIQGDLTKIPNIDPWHRELLWSIAGSFDQRLIESRLGGASKSTQSQLVGAYKSIPSQSSPIPDYLEAIKRDYLPMRPGDLLNSKGSWERILEPCGWDLLANKRGIEYWRKPSSISKHHHATTNGCGDRLMVFSTSAPPFQPNKAYTKFAAYALLYHQGDFSNAAKQLNLYQGRINE